MMRVRTIIWKIPEGWAPEEKIATGRYLGREAGKFFGAVGIRHNLGYGKGIHTEMEYSDDA